MDVLERDDPSNQIGAAWGIKELLRQLLMGNGPTRYSRHLTAQRRTPSGASCSTTRPEWPHDHQRPDHNPAEVRRARLDRRQARDQRARWGVRHDADRQLRRDAGRGVGVVRRANSRVRW
jgi:hypothetical protein